MASRLYEIKHRCFQRLLLSMFLTASCHLQVVEIALAKDDAAKIEADDARVRMMRNENPAGMPPSVRRRIVSQINSAGSQYADFGQRNARTALSNKFGVPFESIALGNGSDEIIRSLPKIFLRPGQNIVAPRFSYIGHKEAAVFNGIPYLEANVGARFEVDVPALLTTANAQTGYVILANPGNPTGASIDQAEMDKLASALQERGIALVIDMAYREYVTDPHLVADPFKTMREHSNVVLIGTFSKMYGLAGLRVGYMIAKPDLIERFDEYREVANASRIGLLAAETAINDQDWVESSRETNRIEREFLSHELRKLGLDVYPSQGNFLLVRVGPDARVLVSNLLNAHSIAILNLAHYGLPEFVRISIGRPQSNRELVRQIKSQLGSSVRRTCESIFAPSAP